MKRYVSKTVSEIKGSADMSKRASEIKGSADMSKRASEIKGSADMSKTASEIKGSADMSKRASEIKGSADMSKTASEIKGSADMSKTASEIKGSADMSKTASEIKGSADMSKAVSEIKGSADMSKTASEIKGSADMSKTASEIKGSADMSKSNKKSALTDRSNIMLKHERKQECVMIPRTCYGNEGKTNTVIRTNNYINYNRKPNTAREIDNRKGKWFSPESGLSKYNHIIDLKMNRNTSGRLDLSVSSSTTPQNDLGSKKDVTKTNGGKSSESRRSFIPRSENRKSLTSWSKQRNSTSPKITDKKSQDGHNSPCLTNRSGSVKQQEEDRSTQSTHTNSDKCLSKEKVGKNSASNLDVKYVTRNQNNTTVYGRKVKTPVCEFDKTRKGKHSRYSGTPINTSSASDGSPFLIEHDNSQIHLDVKTVGKSKQTIVSNVDLINATHPRRNGKLSCKMQTDAPCISRPITLKTDEKTKQGGGSGRVSSSNNSAYLLSRKSALPLIRPIPTLEKLLIKPNLQRNKSSPQNYSNVLETRARKPSISSETSLVSKKNSTSHGQGNDGYYTRRQFNNLNRVTDVYKQSKLIKFTSFGSLPSQQVVNDRDKCDKNYGQKYEKFGNECKQNTQEIRRAVIKSSQVSLLPVQCAKPRDPKNLGTDCKCRDKVVTQSYLRPFDTQTDCILNVKDISCKTKRRYVNDLNVKTCNCVITDDKILGSQNAGIKSNCCDNLNEQALKICHKSNGILLPPVCGPVSTNGVLPHNNQEKLITTNERCGSHNCALVDDSNNDSSENHQDISFSTDVLGNTDNSSNTTRRPGRLKDLAYNKVTCLYEHLSVNQINDLTCTLNTQNTEDLIYSCSSEDHCNLTRGIDNTLWCDIHASHCKTRDRHAYLKDDKNCNNNYNSVECLKDDKGCNIVCKTIDSDININSCIDDSEGFYLSSRFNTSVKKAETNLIVFDLKKDTYTGNRNEISYTMHKRLPQKREPNDTSTTTTRNANIGRDLSHRSGTSISRNVRVDRPLRNDRETTNPRVDKEGQDRTVKVNRNRISSAKSSDSKRDGKLDNTKSSVKQKYSPCNTNDKSANRQRCKTVTCKNKKTNLDAVTHVKHEIHLTTIDGVISEKSKRGLSDIDIANIKSIQAGKSSCTLTQISCVNNESCDHARENEEVKLQLTAIGNYTENGDNVKNNCESAKEISSAYHENKSNNAITFTDEFKSGNASSDQCEVQGAEASLAGSSVLSNTEKDDSVKVINRKYLDSRCSTIKDGALLTDTATELSAAAAARVEVEVNLDESYSRENNVELSKVGVLNICDEHSEKPINNKTETSCISLQSTDGNQSLQNGCEQNRFSSSVLGNFTCVRKACNKEEGDPSSGEQNCKSLDNITLQDGNNYGVFINDCNVGNESVITSDKKDNWRRAMDLQLPSASTGDSDTKLHNDAKLNSDLQIQNILDENCSKINYAQENLLSKLSNHSLNIEDAHVLEQSKLCNKECDNGSDSDVTGEGTIFIQDETVLNIEKQYVSVIESENKPAEVTKTNKSKSKPGEGYTSSVTCSDKTSKVLPRNKSATCNVDNRLKTSLSKSSMNKKVSQPGECKPANNKSGQTGGSNSQRSRSVTPVSKLSSADNISNKIDIKSSAVSNHEKSDSVSKNLHNGNQTGTKRKDSLKMSSASKTAKNQTLKSRIPSASNVKDVSTNVVAHAHTKQDTLGRTSQVIPKNPSDKSKRSEVRGMVSTNRRLSASSSKESSPVVLKTPTPKPSRENTSDSIKDTKNVQKKAKAITREKTPPKQTSASTREKTPPKQTAASTMIKTKTNKAGVKALSPPRPVISSIGKVRDLQTKDNKTIQNKEKLLQKGRKSESPQQSPDLNKARQNSKQEIPNDKTQQSLGSSKSASDIKPNTRSGIPTPKGKALNVKKSDTTTKPDTSPTTGNGNKSNLQNGNKILTLTRQNVQRLSQINNDKKISMSNQSSPALSRKSTSKIGGTDTKSFITRSTASTRARAGMSSRESSPALSRRSSTSCDIKQSKRLPSGTDKTRNTTQKSTQHLMHTAEATKKGKTNKPTSDSKTIKESNTASSKESGLIVPSTGTSRKSAPGAITVIKTTRNTKTSLDIDHNTRSNKESRQVSASNINIVNRHSTAKHVINNKTAVQKADSCRQKKENTLIPRTSTPMVNKIKSSAGAAQDKSQNIEPSDVIEVTASNSQTDIEEVLLPDDALIISSTETQTKTDIKTEDDMHIDGRFRFKTEPEERLPSLMQISRCEMSDTDSDIGDEKATLDTKNPTSANSLPLFESSMDVDEEVPGAPVNDCDILNVHMVDIMDKKSDKFESASVLQDEDGDYINKGGDNTSVSDLEEYWSLSEEEGDENDGTLTESQMDHEPCDDNTSDVKDVVCLDLQNDANNYTAVGLSDTCTNEVAIPEEVNNHVENMKIESRHVQQLHSGESGKHFVQVADDVKTICEIEEIGDDRCIPTQMDYFISQNTYLDQESDKNKYTSDLQDENITHKSKCDPYSETQLINSSERCKNPEDDKNQYGVEDCEEKLPLNTKLDECIDETNDKIKTQMYVDSKGVSIPKHMNGFKDEQVAEGDLEIFSDKMSNLSLRNIILHQNSLDNLSSKSKTSLEETQRCSGLLTVKRESSESSEDGLRDEDDFVDDSATVDNNSENYNACEAKSDNNDNISNNGDLNETEIENETKVVLRNSESFEDFDFDEKQLPALDINSVTESHLDASETENTENIKCLNINQDIPDKNLEDREYNIDFTENKTEPPFTDTESVLEPEELLNAADLNISNSQSQSERLHVTDNGICNINYDKDGDLNNIGISELQEQDSDSDNISEEFCDNLDESDAEMERKMEYLASTKTVTFSVKTGIETDSVSGKRVLRKRRVAKYETVVLPEKDRESDHSDKSEKSKSVKDNYENSQRVCENKGSFVQSGSHEDEGGFVYKEIVQTSCLTEEGGKSEDTEPTGEQHIDTINEVSNLVNLLARQQVSDNDCRTVVNGLSIDSSNNGNENEKHTESLQVCNEGGISETALSNHQRRSVGHSTNSSTNNTYVITPNFKADEPINIEIRANDAMQSQSEIHGFTTGLENLSENEFGVKTGINVIGPSPGSEVLIDSGYDFNARFKGDQRLPSSDNILENQRSDITCNQDSRKIRDQFDGDYSKPYHIDITSFNDNSDNNDILQTNTNDTDSVFVDSEDCLSAGQIPKMAILKTRSSEDDYTGYEQSEEIKINDTSPEKESDLSVKTQSGSFINENKDECTETVADDTIMKNNRKSITNQTPSEDQRTLNNNECSELLQSQLDQGDDNEINETYEAIRLRNLETHTTTDTAVEKSIEKVSDNAEMNKSPENDKIILDLSNQSISRQNETFENVSDLSLPANDSKQVCEDIIGPENTVTLSSVDNNIANDQGSDINKTKDQEQNDNAEITTKESKVTSQTSDKQDQNNSEPTTDGTKPKTISRRDTGRNSFRRHTTNVCMADTLGCEDMFKVPEKPRARSKSPIGRQQIKGQEVKRPPPSCGLGRVSEICKAFIKKASKGTVVTSPERPLSPEPPTTSPTKKLKWVKDCGSWKRIPVDEFGNVTADVNEYKTSSAPSESAPSSADTTDEASQAEVKVNVRDIANKWQMYKRQNKTNKEQEKALMTKQDDSSGVKAGNNESSKSNRGRVPPKTLPKPVMKPAKYLLEPNAVAPKGPIPTAQFDDDETTTTCLPRDTAQDVLIQDENRAHIENSESVSKQENGDLRDLTKLSNDVIVSGTVKDQSKNNYQNNELDSVKTPCSGILSSVNEQVVESNDVVDALSSQNKSYLETDNKLLSAAEDMNDKSSPISSQTDERAKIESDDDTIGKTESCELQQPTSKMESIDTKLRDNREGNVSSEQTSEREEHANTSGVNNNETSKVSRSSGNKYMKPDKKFGLTKSLMAAKPYVKSETDINQMPDLDSELYQGGNLASAETSISTTIGSPKLKAIRIKQEMFPKEDTDDNDSTDNLISSKEKDKTRRDAAQWISPIKEALYQLKKQENIEHENYNPNVKFYISDSDESVSRGRSRSFDSTQHQGQGTEKQILDVFHERSSSSGQGLSLLNRPLLDQDNVFSKQYSNSGKYVYSGYLGQPMDQKPMLANVDYKHDGGEAMYYPRSPGAVQKQLLSEILELEENINEENTHNYDQDEQDNEGEESEPCSTPTKTEINDVTKNHQEYRRSNSLPSGSLSDEMDHTIYYKDGQFVIEPNRKKFKDIDFEIPSPDKNSHKKKFNFDNYGKVKSPKHCRNERENEFNYYEDEADVFVENDGNVTVIETDESLTSPVSDHGGVHKRLVKCDSEGQISRPLSVDENQLESFMSDSKSAKNENIRNSKHSGMRNRRSASFKDIRPKKIKVKRNSSFKEAQEKGSIQDSEHYDHDTFTPDFIQKEELRPKSPGFLQKLLSRRRFSEKGASTKTSEQNKDISSSSKKTSLRNLFLGKKGKGRNASIPNFSSEPGTPGTPPIAAFHNDLDIHIVESAPNSPFSNRQFLRRHTSADIYEQNNQGMYQSATDVSNYRTQRLKSDDQISVQSLVINPMEQPLRPKSPKPTGVTITRRNSNLSLHNSPHKDVHFDLGSRNDMDSISMCSVVSSNIDNVTSVTFDSSSSRRPSKNQGVLQHDKGFSDLVQGEMSYSNSNDSGIQHDVSAHSSNESLKTSQDSTSSVIRRRKSPSPRPERPKSEISVRWADLVETTEITPVKRREGSQNLKNKPRPISDLEDNIEFFDEMYGDVLDDFQSITGGSSLSPDMKSSFGSQISLQPYSSLQNLEKLKRQDSIDSKPCKRRMSTPHPIKSRQKQATPKQKKQQHHHTIPLVRSHSMPESLDKLHKKKKYITLGSSNLHGEGLLHHGEDDSSSDDGSDISIDRMSLYEKSLSARSSNIQLATLDEISEVENLIFAEALWDHITMDPEELGFRAGDVIEVMDNSNKDWWWGAVDDKDGEREGWFPATFVRLRVNQEQIEEELATRLQEVAPEHRSPKLRRISMINQDQARENVVNEIIHAEREYVKHLKDVVEGYVRHARKRTDMFSEERISVMFGNIEEIYDFSNRFLESLESAFQEDHPHLSELGQCFLDHSKEFEIYSDYCNNHPSASEELKDSYRKQKYRHFFEACRLLQEMIEIPLEGFLLTPVQKICKYPLQLAELLKYTSTSHPDYTNVQAALESMKKSAALINERKRKMESIEKLSAWQQTVEDWQGSDLLERSSELILAAEANKINSAGWSQERFFFLFDHQLVYCKKDLLKKNGYSYKGRIDMDNCEIVPLEDGKDSQYNVTVKNAWKIHEISRDKWYLLFAKTAAEKQRWLKAYNTERQRVREDQENNFVPVYWKRNILNKLKANKAKTNPSRNTALVDYTREFIRGMPSHATLPRSFGKKQQEKKKGWFVFGKQKSK